MPKKKCPCCNIGIIPGAWEECPVCGWNDDCVQEDNPDMDGGNNTLSLNQARKEWAKKQKRKKQKR